MVEFVYVYISLTMYSDIRKILGTDPWRCFNYRQQIIPVTLAFTIRKYDANIRVPDNQDKADFTTLR